MIAPHGGKFVERILTDHEKAKVLSRAASYPTVEVDDGTAADVKNIARGVYSPLTGFMTRDDLDSVVKKMRLTNGLIWSIPIVLSVPDSAKSNIRNQEDVLLVGKNKKVIALMKVEDIYEYDKETFAEFVFSTKDKEHPGVAEIKDIGDTLIGGSISLIDESREPFEKYNLEPKETRFLFKEMGWKTIAAFQTRNAPHMAHEYLQRSALEIVDGLFINPVIGKKKKGDEYENNLRHCHSFRYHYRGRTFCSALYCPQAGFLGNSWLFFGSGRCGYFDSFVFWRISPKNARF